MNYIGRKMIEDGLMANVIIVTKKEGNLAAQIGEHWFWFGWHKFYGKEIEEISFHEKVDAIKDALDDFYRCSETYGDEYLYYYYYICEHI